MSQNIVLSGNVDMLHSLYDFKATYARTLSFKMNEYFILHQTNTKHKNWWEVVNASGELGYIPSNYVETVTVNPSFFLKFIKKALKSLNKHTEKAPSADMDTVCSKLYILKEQIEQLPNLSGDNGDITPSIKSSDSVLTRSESSSSSHTMTVYKPPLSEMEEEPIRPIQTASKDRVRKSIENIHEEVSSEYNGERKKSDAGTQSITENAVYELIESVRINTQLSHEMSRVAVVTVVQGLHELLPASVFPYLSTILSKVQSAMVVDYGQIEQTHDASRLKIIFTELTTCKEDSQQRSWMLHEDEDVIKEYLLELISILSNADSSISKHVISTNDYESVITLIQYYQMETRWTIRQLLLQTFGVLCNLDKTIVSIMLISILPGELARDMMANPRNIPKLNYSSILLTMIFSMGEEMPVTHHEILGDDFLKFLFDNIEYPPDTDMDDQIPDLFLNCIISFNLQFRDTSQNLVLNALETRDVAKTFTEKILLLFNREHDPVRIFDHEPAPPHSVLKLFIDLLSRKHTADLFYTNDVKVLIDIVVRNLADLSPGEKRRHYLELTRRIMQNTNYGEHRHRNDEIIKAFTRMFCEENDDDGSGREDQNLIKEIYSEFPEFFK